MSLFLFTNLTHILPMKLFYFPNGITVLLFIFSLCFFENASSQVGIGTTNPDSNSKLDINSTIAEPGGLLLPRVALSATNLPAPLTGTITNGMAVYNTATAGSGAFLVTPGFYYHDGVSWVRLATATQAGENWALTGNASTNPGTGAGQNFIGTRDGQSLILATQSNAVMRLLPTGQVVVNNNAPFGGIVFNSFSAASEHAIGGGAINGYGVYGEASGTGIGIVGISNNASGIGVRAANNNVNGVGLMVTGGNVGGLTLAGLGATIAASRYGGASFGRNLNNGTGFVGIGNGSTTIQTLASGSGLAGSGDTGVYGISTTANGGTGIVGVGNNSNSIITLVNGSGLAGTGLIYGVYGYSTTGGDGFGGAFQSNYNGEALVGGWVGTTRYKILGTGTVSTIVQDVNEKPIIMFATEAPEVLFQDYGIGKLFNGKAVIKIDPNFSKNIQVNLNHPLKVFVQLEGDCKGVYVTEKSSEGFTVKELQGGMSNVSFSWQIVATRADEKTIGIDGDVKISVNSVRFPPGPKKLDKIKREKNSITAQDVHDIKLREKTTNSQILRPIDSEEYSLQQSITE